MLAIRFLQTHKDNDLPDLVLQQKMESEVEYWQPIVMGVATPEQIRWADAAELQYYNELAIRKRDIWQVIAEGRPLADE